MSGKDDGMAYGHYPGNGGEESERASGGGGARGFLGDQMRKFRDKYNEKQSQYPGQGQQQGQHPQGQQQQYDPQQGQQQYNPQGGYPGGPPPQQQQQQQAESSSGKPTFVSGLMGKVQGFGSDIAQRIGSNLDPQAYATYGPGTTHEGGQNRHGSFAPERQHNEAKWYVDGCSYMWAVSRALESAKESIWILDWWLSPELYLRRPPAKNEQYRVDRMLQAAAQRGVKVNIVVYKEVTQALTLCSHHTKHHLEDLHPNIGVFRYPDHLPDRQTIHSNIVSSLKDLALNPAGVAKTSTDALKSIYGMQEDMILYWAHHEKLCIVDGKTAFMGGLDLCYGRWDTYQHSIADVHGTDVNQTIFPGQDYNNNRIMDFQDVPNWQNNKLDRKQNSRMGWSDVSLSLQGPAVEDLRRHFSERWNFIYDQKYTSRKDDRYARIVLYQRPLSGAGHHSRPHSPQPPQGQQQQQQPPSQHQPQQQQQQQGQYGAPGNTPGGQSPAQPQWTGQPPSSSSQPYFPPPPTSSDVPPQGGQSGAQSQPYFPPPPTSSDAPPQGGQTGGPPQTQTRGVEGSPHGHSDRGPLGGELRGLKEDVGNFGRVLRGQLAGQVHQYQDRYLNTPPGQAQGAGSKQNEGSMYCQVVRSSAKWSLGIPTESSIQSAYATVIRESEHFVYIENQFFITATGDKQEPVKNQIGAAIVERIVRAARNGQKYKMIVVIPAVPCFAGDLHAEESLGTRAIMEFQYASINRGGHSILESIARQGVNPMEYIRFYNLRNYDRLNVSAALKNAEQASGVGYGQAQQQYDAAANKTSFGVMSAFDTTVPQPQLQQYQQAAGQQGGTTGGATSGGKNRWDSVSECYMLGGEDIRNVPWENGDAESEIDAFVTEELYVHSKVLIADDRTVICGSANINDRSQLGYHDSEIALIIQDPNAVSSTMNGQQYPVSRYATTLRRQLTRKHLGLLRPQDCERPDMNREPVWAGTNEYDMGSAEDLIVVDPLSDKFLNQWNEQASTNTGVYRKVFHSVPDDTVRTWNDYKEFYEYYFVGAGDDKDQKEKPSPQPQPQAGAEGQGQGQDQQQQQQLSSGARYTVGHVVRDDFPAGDEGARAVKEELSKVKGTVVEMPLMFLSQEDIALEGMGLNAMTEEIYT